METAISAPDGTVPPPNSPTSAAAEATAVTQKFKDLDLGIREHGSGFAGAVGDTVPTETTQRFRKFFEDTDPTEITRRFKNLDISSRSPHQMGTNSAQSTAADSSHARPRPKPVHITLDIPTQDPGQPINLQSEPLGGYRGYFIEGNGEVDQLDGNDAWSESLAMRLAIHKTRTKHTRTASKRMSRGPIRNKVGGVSRHRHNISRMSPADS